jgi:hypothetical protein
MSQGEDPDDLYCVRFRLEPEDLLVAYRTTLPRNRRVIAYAVSIFLAIGAAFGWIIGSGLGRYREAITATGAVVGVIVLRWLRRRAERWHLRACEVAGLLLAQTLRISEEGYELEIEDGRKTSGPWTNILRVGKTTDCFFMQSKQDSRAISIHLRNFRSESHEYLFLLMARLWHAKANRSSTDVTDTEKV